VRPKIVCAREAPPRLSDDNGVMHAQGIDRVATRRLPSDTSRRVALIVVVVLAAAYEANLPAPAGGAPRSTEIVLSVLSVVAVIVARRWPSLAAAGATLVAVTILRTQDAPLAVASFCVVVFSVAQLVTRRGLLIAAPLLLPFVVLALRRLETHSALNSTAPLLFLVAALAVGESIRRRRMAMNALEASQEAMAESARAQIAMEERARIARELHDIVAHHLSVITIESEAARLTSPQLSLDAADRLEAIGSTAREALTETRRLLGVLREDDAGEADRTPQPGLGELDDLIERARATGTDVRLTRQGKITQFPLSIDVAAYRIVQEALTNARRHAPGADVDVDVSYRDHALQLSIRDHGPGVSDRELEAGHGLTGMRERATLAGGSFSAGPANGGGFEVNVTLPTIASAT
jgi:signal transduction histidine kinase